VKPSDLKPMYECRLKHRHIRVNAVSPGFIETPRATASSCVPEDRRPRATELGARPSSPEPYSAAMQYTSPSQSYDMPTRMGEPSGKRNVPREKVSGMISFWAAIRGDRPAAMRGFSSREVPCAC
jgi:NAD(P)-dependent dehydrogenase (short-subunit alcohol dehydrogenase family)